MNASATERQADQSYMREALELAQRGAGRVEPNPQVGCVLVRDGRIVGRGWHQQFGGPHAEVEALADAGSAARGATMYVTLEPCCHHGKTPPCTGAILAAGVARVVVAHVDPFPQVAGGGVRQLREAGVAVEVGVAESEAAVVLAPFLRLVRDGRPWVIAKWAMTLDGKLAAAGGDSRWISNARSREIVHRLRGRVDAVLVGGETARQDDPRLTARPPGPRVAARIVVSVAADLPPDAQLLATLDQAPLLIAATSAAPAERIATLRAAGAEVLMLGGGPRVDLSGLLAELGRRRMTNVLVEGGSQLLGALLDQQAIDEVHAFIAPKLIGGAAAPTPAAGTGLARMSDAATLVDPQVEILDGDVYLRGRMRYNAATSA